MGIVLGKGPGGLLLGRQSIVLGPDAPPPPPPDPKESLFKFDGVNDRIGINSAYKPDFTEPFSIEMTVTGESLGGASYLMSFGNSSTSTPMFTFYSDTVDNTKIKTFVRNSTNGAVINLTSTITVFDGNRHTVRFEFDGVDTMTIYVDDVAAGSDTVAVTPPTPADFNRVTLGCLGRTSFSNYTSASLHEVKLTADGVLQNHYKLDEGSGLVVGDSVGVADGLAVSIDETVAWVPYTG